MMIVYEIFDKAICCVSLYLYTNVASCLHSKNTVNVGIFAWLNVHSFNPMEFLLEYFCSAFARSAYYLV